MYFYYYFILNYCSIPYIFPDFHDLTSKYKSHVKLGSNDKEIIELL